MNRVPVTALGEKMLREELRQLKSAERPAIIQAIAEARAHGDLKENAEYHAARERQGFVEGRIADLEDKISRMQVIDVLSIAPSGRVIFGATVVLENIETSEKLRYHIVGEDEADYKISKISVSSPVARAIVGKENGDVVVVQTPTGQVEFEIIEVLHI